MPLEFGRPTAQHIVSTVFSRVAPGIQRFSGFDNASGTWWLLTALLLLAAPVSGAEEPFDGAVRAVLQRHCLQCHSTKLRKGELDLEQFRSEQDVRRQPGVWERVLEQLDQGEMPPNDQPQLAPDEKTLLAGWTRAMLDRVALANAGDPGAVVLRRLSNMEYTYSLRDLTGLDTLDPAKDFPVDGAAGEGFTNVGSALVMSPALLTKYLDAAKGVADHVVLLPNGIRFSPSTTQRDWTNESLARIRAFYGKFTDEYDEKVAVGGTGLVDNDGGGIPLEKYLAAIRENRQVLKARPQAIAQIAEELDLSAKYLRLLWDVLNETESTPVLDSLHAKWRSGVLEAADIERWQKALWKFGTVGQISVKAGSKTWQSPNTPIESSRELKLSLASFGGQGDVTLQLVASDAGDGREHDFVVWQNPRLVIPGREDIPLRDVPAIMAKLSKRREAVIASAASCLAAAAEADRASKRTDISVLSAKHRVDADVLAGWLTILGIGTSGEARLGARLAKPLNRASDYEFIKGWTGEQALSVLANSSDNQVRIPGIVKPHSIVVHPSPTTSAVIAWRSPVEGEVRVHGSVQHAHPECGNGVGWRIELRRGQTEKTLAHGVSYQGPPVTFGAFERLSVHPGDAIAVVIEPRDGNHSCDLTAVELTIRHGEVEWDLAKDVSPNIVAANPLSDGKGNKAVWHFLGEPVVQKASPAIPEGSVLAEWLNASGTERSKIAQRVQRTLEQGASALAAKSPNHTMYLQLLAMDGPLVGPALNSVDEKKGGEDQAAGGVGPDSRDGLHASMFGTRPNGGEVAPTDIYVQAPSRIEVRLPEPFVKNGTFVVTGRLHSVDGKEGSVQLSVSAEGQPALPSGIDASEVVIANEGSAARRRFEAAFDDFRQVFPAVLCYTKIVPVDEVVTLTLYHREDEMLRRLMLTDEQAKELDRLWDELLFVAEEPLALTVAFEQISEFATQDRPDLVKQFAPLRPWIYERAETFRQQQKSAEPQHVEAVVRLADRAWRRPLAETKQAALRELYSQLRDKQLPHASAVRLLLARVLASPEFLYRGEEPGAGRIVPVSDWELATRLSYFLWSSAPDATLTSLAAAGKLHDKDVLVAQMRRMLKDRRTRRLAVEFGCQWLHVRDLESLSEKSERHFPTFVGLRGDMQEEVAQFFLDMFQQNQSVLSLLDADHSFVNGALAEHYGFSVTGTAWQRVDGLRARGRGGILGFAGTLAKQSGASRTSPILRGNWVSEVVLGEKLPRPPKDVPVLPDETPEGLTERQLIERHSSDPACAKCHARIDHFGFALEGFDAIGRAREKDTAGLPVNTTASLPGGGEIAGLDGLRSYLLKQRRDDFLRQFCRKLLGYALGRSVQLSDKPLVDSMLEQLRENQFRVDAALAVIVSSEQFRSARGKDFVVVD